MAIRYWPFDMDLDKYDIPWYDYDCVHNMM